MVDVKKRKISSKDWVSVEEFIKKELDKRKGDDFRKYHEQVWTEVDRQIAMKPQTLIPGEGTTEDWHSAIELGELAKASEIITADVRRIMFPQARSWMEAHCEPPKTFNPETGKQVVAINPDIQEKGDELLRSLMTQQHVDFGLKDRVELSIKEALHHGSFVAEVDSETQSKIYDGTGVESISAPVWIPHSMWNCYPDPSPSVIGTNMFYTGSMMIVSYMPRYKVLQFKGEGFMNLVDSKIPKKTHDNKDVETEDIQLVKYYGDLVIPRGDGDIYLPNSKCITANGVLIFYAPNKRPYPPVIFRGYERQDVRDPYYTSPIIKLSPTQKLASLFANSFVNGTKLSIEPPIVYDGSDPYFVQNGGPAIFPGAKTASRGSNKFETMKIGDPMAALQGMEMAVRQIQEGTGVNAVRAGVTSSDRKTATEISKTAQGAEVRTVDFVDKLECGLRTFLYMQHDINLEELTTYTFYCSDPDLPDFNRVSKKDLPKGAHFEVVGSKGLLGEEQRTQRMTQVTAFASSDPGFAPLLKRAKLLIDMYEDAGVKGPEIYVETKQPEIPLEVQQKMQLMAQQNQELQAGVQQLQGELEKAKSGEAAKMAELQAKSQSEAINQRFEMQQAAMDAHLEKQEMMMKDSFDRWKVQITEANKILLAQISAKAGIEQSTIAAANKEVSTEL